MKKNKPQRASGASKPPQGNLNISLIQHIPELIAKLGFDPIFIFNELQLDMEQFKNPNNKLSYDDLGRLLSYCVEYCQSPNFGLLVGQGIELESMGMLGMLVRNAPTVGAGLQIGERNMQLNDRGAVASMVVVDETHVAMTYTLQSGATIASNQIIDAATVLHYKLLHALCGPEWKPKLVRIAHKPPNNTEIFSEYFGQYLEFDTEISSIVFEAKWLAREIPGANAELFQFIIKTIKNNPDSHSSPLSERVRRALHTLILSKTANSAYIAFLFEMNERTLRRRLKFEGLSLRELENEVRCELSCQLLRDTQLPILSIANIMGFSNGQVFARAFRLWKKMSPTAWRNLLH